ncbi:MAG: DUF3788 domain-containing protein [Bacteroidales bacterium]|nr:DUF3788 domain-containing protein [Bacteroidales bacterium]MCF8454431.1 DUF3788 domain-containing protein [Bacteroidales bacterium]
MDKSIFEDKTIIPSDDDLKQALGEKYDWWKNLREFVLGHYPTAREEWNYPGEKYGWSFRIKDKKRAILYFLPRDGFFKIAFVFGQKATDQIMASNISESIKKDLNEARVYAEGRGIRIDVKEQGIITDLQNMVLIKLAN